MTSPKRGVLGLALALVGLVAAAAQAGPINLAWDQCRAEGGIANKYFACDTNARYEYVVGSFVPQVAMADFIAMAVVIDGETGDGSALPDWWQLYNSGACRQSALSCSFDFLAFPNLSCQDPWQGAAAGGIAAYYTAASAPKYSLEILDAGHNQFLDDTACFQCGTCTAGDMADDEVRTLARRALRSFYEATLRDDDQFLPWLRGLAGDEDVITFQHEE